MDFDSAVLWVAYTRLLRVFVGRMELFWDKYPGLRQASI